MQFSTRSASPMNLSVDYSFNGYRCPRCGKLLVLNQNNLQCENQHRFPVVSGVPNFLRHHHKDDEEAAEKLKQLNKIAKTHGWQAALKSTAHDNPGKFQYVTDKSRTSFLDLIPFGDESKVLELGCSLGQITEHICRRAALVYAMDVVEGQAHFTQTRCAQEAYDNISVSCGGDDCLLPYPDAYFDCVIVNLVLEWCGMRATMSPIESQQLFLKECTRVLKKNGFLFVATKNRFSIRYLVGRPDEHAYEMPFGNALPRWLMAFFLHLANRSYPQSRLFSYRGLKNELRRAGYEKVQAFWAIPHPRFPIEYVDFDKKSINDVKGRLADSKKINRATRVLFRLPRFILPHITEGLVFLGEKSRGCQERVTSK